MRIEKDIAKILGGPFTLAHSLITVNSKKSPVLVWYLFEYFFLE